MKMVQDEGIQLLESILGKPISEITDGELEEIAGPQIPYGYCHCGCGQKTKLHPFNDASKCHVKGEPKRFISGHQNRGSLNGQYKVGWRLKVKKPSGLCECGCGQQTEIAVRSRPYLGVIAGHPLRFIRGHARKGQGTPAYATVYMPEHPRANSGGRVLKHIVIAEKALGKPLPPGAQVHHHTPDQLVICQNQAYHSLLHQRQRAYEVCGHASWRKCWICKNYDDPEKLSIADDRVVTHPSCVREYKRTHQGLTSYRYELDLSDYE